MLKDRYLDRPCERSRPKATSHWHHVCWNCGTELCGAETAATSDTRYQCEGCSCGESMSLWIPAEKGYDPEVAAAFPSPA